MASFNIANLKKTVYYLQRNGVKNTWNAAKERLEQAKADDYQWQPLSSLEWKAGRDACMEMLEELEMQGRKAPTFSILVPAYQTNPVFLKELVESLKGQTYPNWEVLILDASKDDGVKDALKEICIVKGIPLSEEKVAEQEAIDWISGSIRYIRLSGNQGISENTNAGLPLVRGEYIGLLDHDDVLTLDALQSMADAILENREKLKKFMDTDIECGEADDRQSAQRANGLVRLLYSDEDKWNGEEDGYYEPNFKEDFQPDLLLTNNYICHFLVLDTKLFRELGLRKEYDGAQDFDLVLRATERIRQDIAVLQNKEEIRPEEALMLETMCIVHIPRVLYHWRCHKASTAENPRSKTYAYDAGRKAVQDSLDRQGIAAKAEHLKHVGFYGLKFGDVQASISGKLHPFMKYRKDVAAVGGKVVCKSATPYVSTVRKKLYEGERIKSDKRMAKGSIVGGRMDKMGKVYYYGLHPGYSGYLHRAVLLQDAYAVDLRCICVAEEYHQLFEEVVGVPYVTGKDSYWFDYTTLSEEADRRALSLKFGEELQKLGKRILWDPDSVEEI